MRLVLAVLVVLSTACFSRTNTISSAGGRVATRPPGATYPNWEYFCFGVTSGIGAEDNINRALARAGSEGWELVTFGAGVFCFKRPIAVIAAAPTWPAAPG